MMTANRKMKMYQSPLSMGSILLFIGGAYLTIRMLNGAWPTYFAFVFLGMGVVMFVIDYFIRKSAMKFGTKIFIQSLCIVVPLLVGYLFFTGKL
jgi:predicted membrane channel-forming protein YqfA (hemolysin III family)